MGVERLVWTEYFGVEDSDHDGTTAMESATMFLGRSAAGVTIEGDGIGHR